MESGILILIGAATVGAILISFITAYIIYLRFFRLASLQNKGKTKIILKTHIRYHIIYKGYNIMLMYKIIILQ